LDHRDGATAVIVVVAVPLHRTSLTRRKLLGSLSPSNSSPLAHLSLLVMLMLSKLNNILSRVLDFPDLHTAVLLTVSGELISYAADINRPKDEIRVVVGLAGEIWQETREQEYGMVESEVSWFCVSPTVYLLLRFRCFS
jgi:hypothetical protein